MGSSESYGRDFGVPRDHKLEPGYEGEPPPERRGPLYYVTTAVGLVLALALYTMIAIAEINLIGGGSVDAAMEGVMGVVSDYLVLIWLVPTVVAFILLVFKPTRGFATGFLGASAFGLLACLALAVFLFL